MYELIHPLRGVNNKLKREKRQLLLNMVFNELLKQVQLDVMKSSSNNYI